MTGWHDAHVLTRARRFIRSLWASCRYALSRRRRALSRPQELWLVRTIRRAWLVSDPTWFEHRARFPVPAEVQAELEESERRRQERRAKLASDGPVLYEGQLTVRAIYRGLLLDLPQRPGIEDWLTEQLALDDYYGETVQIRLVAELLHDPRPPSTEADRGDG